jgi:adenine-specific DNA-methyltransferase
MAAWLTVGDGDFTARRVGIFQPLVYILGDTNRGAIVAFDVTPNAIGEVELRKGDVLDELVNVADDQFDLIISSPPYNIGKRYERDRALTISEYRDWQKEVVVALTVKAKETASLCWQVGSHVKDGTILPLDILLYPVFEEAGWKLRNRIIWRFNFGHNSDRRFSGRYETVLWFTKGDNYKFRLDPIRIPQLYPGKRHSQKKGEKAGTPSGNPKGKNPSDLWEFSPSQAFLHDPVWDIPNVKSNHLEQTTHPCQFPIELAERCVLGMTEPGDYVLDPFVGTGSSVLAAAKHGRNAVGIDKEQEFLDIARQRIELLASGNLPMRPMGMPVRRPVPGEKVSTVPEEWLVTDEDP